MNELFDQAGYKLQTGAKIIMGIGMFLSLAGCITFVALHPFGYEVTFPDVLVGLVILLVGVLFSWFFSLLIFGFGQLVENSEVSTSIAVHNYNRQQKNAEADDPEADKDSRQQQVFQKYMYWTCPECGTVNMSTDNYCTECGLKNKT